MAYTPMANPQRPMVSVKLALLSIVAVMVTLVAGQTPAFAHDAVIKSSPADGTTLSAFPTDVSLTMSANPKPEFNTIAVSNKDTGEIVAKGAPTLNGNVLTFDLPDDLTVAAGHYTVGFQITSSDGHATRGAINFTYAPEGQDSTAATPGASNSAADSSDNTGASQSGGSGVVWLIIALVAIVVVAAGVAVALRRRRRG